MDTKQQHTPATWDSAYPGSIGPREDGQYIDRDDAKSLAYALLQRIESQDRTIEDLRETIQQQHDELVEVSRYLRLMLVDDEPSNELGKRAWDAWEKASTTLARASTGKGVQGE
jgi:hypothetical protein